MILQPIDFVVYAWLIVALLSATYVAYDQFRYNPEAQVMKWGFARRRESLRTRRTAALTQSGMREFSLRWF